MNSEELFDAITDIREDILEEAREHKPKNRARLWRRVIAAAAAVAVVTGLALSPWADAPVGKEFSDRTSWIGSIFTCMGWPEREEPLPSEPWSYTGSHAISLAAYAPLPQGQDWGLGAAEQKAHQAAYENWLVEAKSLHATFGYQEGLEHFLRSSIPAFLTAGEENQVYSPVGTFMTLGMLAETTHGESRAQLLELLGFSDLDALREKAVNVWQGCYSNDGNVRSILANSVWLNETIAYRRSVMENLTQYYYASSFQGDMGSEEYSEMLSQWINAQTGGTMDAQASQPKLGQSTAMEVISAVSFNAKWGDPFEEDELTEGEFHGTKEDVACVFMCRSEAWTYYRGQRFGAVAENLMEGNQIWFILPDEGVSAAQLLSDEQTLEFILANEQWESRENAWVYFFLPKFNVDSRLDLSEGLKALGVTDVFCEETADFSAMAQGETEELVLGEITQQTRVAVDEYGVSAGSFTRGETIWRSGAEKFVWFRLDRPFIFFITNAEGLPLFVGIVNQV